MKKTKPEEARLEVVYALRHIKSENLLSMRVSSNGNAEFCNDHTVRLEIPYNDIYEWNPDTWYIDTAYNAEYVRQFSTEWYNSSERTPNHTFEPEELEVVQVERIVKTLKVKAKIPTFEEYLEIKYRDKEPEHCDYILGEYKKHPDSFRAGYSLYDLMMLIENEKWKTGEDDGKNLH